MSCKIYTFDRVRVFFKHTDYHGYVHPYNYYEWTSYVRESFFQEIVPGFSGVVERPIKMMTAKISMQLFKQGFFADQISAQFTVVRIKKCSFDVRVRFFNQRCKEPLCMTQHTLVFWDANKGGFAVIPEEIRQEVIKYDEEKNG